MSAIAISSATPYISAEIRAYLSSIYFEGLFFDKISSIHTIALRGTNGMYRERIYPLVIELMEKHPEWIDNKILLNSSYLRINGIICNYCSYKNLQEKICAYLEKQKFLDWSYFVVNAETFKPLSIKVDTENIYLLMLLLKQLDKTTEKNTSIQNQQVNLLD